MNRIKISLVLFAVVVASLLLAACGGNEEPEEVLKETFTTEPTEQISSGVVDIQIKVDAGDTGTFSLALGGPFQTNLEDPDAVPQFDLDGEVNGTISGQSIGLTGGLVVTEDAAFVKYGSDSYELDAEAFAGLRDDLPSLDADADEEAGADDPIELIREACRDAATENGSDAAICDEIDPGNWAPGLSNEGTTELDGVDVIHITSDIDFARFIADIAAIGTQVSGDEAPSQEEIDQVSGLVSGAKVDVYTGEDDKILRRVALSFTLDPSSIPGEAASAASEVGEIKFEIVVTISDVNQPQTITAPENAKSIEELGQAAMGGGLLGGLLGGFDSGSGSSTGGGFDDMPTAPEGDYGDMVDDYTEQYSAYLECVEAAGDNPAEMQGCLALLPADE